MKGVFISTYGCQMNVNDTERMYSLLEMANYMPVQDPEQASLIILNSCSVREKPVHKIYSEVGRYRKLKDKNPDLRIGVGGCVGQQEKSNLIKTAPLIDFVFGTDSIDQLPEIISESYSRGTNNNKNDSKNKVVNAQFKHSEPYHIETLVRNPGVATFVNITKGCDNFCSFCVVPFTRGRERSRPMAHILKDIQTLTQRGVREVTLLGQNVNSYKSECGADFASLLKSVATETDVARIRYTTSHPKDFNEELVEVLAAHKNKICEYLHLPIQSGNSEVLERMNRGYTREEYLAKIKMIRSIIPDMSFSTDIIVGFPGETENQFLDTLSAVQEAAYETLFAFQYSPRPMTKAARFEDQVAEEVKNERLNRLFEFHNALAFAWVKKYENQRLEVLVEKCDKGVLQGRTRHNKLVHFQGPKELGPKDLGPEDVVPEDLGLNNSEPDSLVGQMVEVLITKANPATFRGQLCLKQ